MGVKSLLVFFLLLGALTSVTWFLWDPLSPPTHLPQITPRWWGKGNGDNQKKDESVRKFTLSVPPKELDKLKAKLRDTVYPEPLEGVHFEYGFNSHYLKDVVVDHWLNRYNWSKEESLINSFNHFKTQVDGIDVHFVHVKPNNVKANVKVLPIMLIHGWPGSFVEFLQTLPLLTTSRKGQEFVFEVICPSIPGYGLSEAPHHPGFSAIEAAHMFDKLMTRLGFQSYYVQGGDWGSLIAFNMAVFFPQRVKGIHVNMVFRVSLKDYVNLAVGQYAPWLLGIDAEDYEATYPIKEKFLYLLSESGYMHIQATKPDTVGMGLTNSPAALAAYILEKFSTWTDKSGIEHPQGKLTEKYTLDQLLTNVMIYWVTGTITSSQRFYKENFSAKQMAHRMSEFRPTVPAGVASFPNELIVVTKHTARNAFPNLVSFTKMPRGGHFAAFEEPQLLADDIWNFVAIVEKLSRATSI